MKINNNKITHSLFGLVAFCLATSWSVVSAADNEYQNLSSDFSITQRIPKEGLTNRFHLSAEDFAKAVQRGRLHAINYPVQTTKFLPPYRPLQSFFGNDPMDPLKLIIRGFIKEITNFKSVNDLMSWVGMHPYPKESDTGIYSVPYPNGKRPEYMLGFTQMERYGAQGFTFSCAGCHSGSLFGKTILGLTNRYPRAYEAFTYAHALEPIISSRFLSMARILNPGEAKMMSDLKKSLKTVGPRKPTTMGLDVSIAFTSRTLSRRNNDEWAMISPYYQKHPRADWNDNHVSDTKPPPWWLSKYKTKWGPDGSFVAGNPVFTNLLWNEIGRGADLREFDKWLDQNQEKYIELTSAVFSSEAPLWTDFFSADSIDLKSAQRGENYYNESCARCHGTYEKNWNAAGASAMSPVEVLKTSKVIYHEVTPIKEVGTDPMRRLATASIERMNDLAIQKKYGTIFKQQTGYVPQPLVGIWARWPYFHNNSIPSLCALLTRAEDRPKAYYSGLAIDRNRDFDRKCNGYPMGQATPKDWKKHDHYYDTRKQGLSNAGHDEGIFLQDGVEIYTPDQKMDIIEYLKTL